MLSKNWFCCNEIFFDKMKESFCRFFQLTNLSEIKKETEKKWLVCITNVMTKH